MSQIIWDVADCLVYRSQVLTKSLFLLGVWTIWRWASAAWKHWPTHIPVQRSSAAVSKSVQLRYLTMKRLAQALHKVIHVYCFMFFASTTCIMPSMTNLTIMTSSHHQQLEFLSWRCGLLKYILPCINIRAMHQLQKMADIIANVVQLSWGLHLMTVPTLVWSLLAFCMPIAIVTGLNRSATSAKCIYMSLSCAQIISISLEIVRFASIGRDYHSFASISNCETWMWCSVALSFLELEHLWLAVE